MELTMYFIVLLFLLAIVYSFGRPFFRGAPFAPTDKRTMAAMIKLSQVKPGERACDIGSGDGRLVIALAKVGAIADGYEINPFLVWWSKLRIKYAGLTDRANIYRKNIWKANFSTYDVLTLFGIPYIMPALEQKLRKELKPGARVASNAFKFPQWPPAKRESGVILYIRN